MEEGYRGDKSQVVMKAIGLWRRDTDMLWRRVMEEGYEGVFTDRVKWFGNQEVSAF